MSDPIKEALAGVEADADADDPGAAQLGEEPTAMPEGPPPDDDHADADPDGDDGGFSLFDWASSVPEGTHLDHDARDWWDPETGGETRLAFHLSHATGGESVGYPNALGVLVGVGEMYWSAVKGESGDDHADADPDDAPDAEEVSRETAEGLV